MCKACRQRSIWARIKLFSSISCFRTSRSHLCNLSLSKYWQGSSSEVLTFFCERLSTSSSQQTSTLIICLFFKDRFALHYTSTINKAFCLSTAEKRNYALLFTTCQELFYSTSQKNFLTFATSLCQFQHRQSRKRKLWSFHTLAVKHFLHTQSRFSIRCALSRHIRLDFHPEIFTPSHRTFCKLSFCLLRKLCFFPCPELSGI